MSDFSNDQLKAKYSASSTATVWLYTSNIIA